jgi:hypothetical protein
VSAVVPILLIALGGFLIGGVLAVRDKSTVGAVALGVLSAACVVGGILWLL